MVRVEQVKFCRICNHRKYDISRGIVCSLTNEYATFQEECEEFLKNEKLEKEEIRKETEIKELEEEEREDPGIIAQYIRPVIIIAALFAIGIMMISNPHEMDHGNASGRHQILFVILKLIWGTPTGAIAIILSLLSAHNFYNTKIKKPINKL